MMLRRVTLLENAQSSPFQTWVETITCTKRSDGTFSLRLKLSGEERVTWPAGVTRLRTPEQFVRAYKEILRDLHYDGISNFEIAADICVPMEALDKDFAQQLLRYLNGAADTQNSNPPKLTLKELMARYVK